MKILGLDASPRDNGNTEKLVNGILEGAASNGMETRFYKLAKMKISPCDGCIVCREKGICGINDDMQILYDEIQSKDHRQNISGLTRYCITLNERKQNRG